MCSIDMFKIAKRNFDAAEGLRKLFWNDESQINLVAYHLQLCSNIKLVDEALIEIKQFLVRNGITENLRDELKDEQVKEQLLSLLPKNTEYNTIELNCYYQVFQKKIK